MALPHSSSDTSDVCLSPSSLEEDSFDSSDEELVEDVGPAADGTAPATAAGPHHHGVRTRRRGAPGPGGKGGPELAGKRPQQGGGGSGVGGPRQAAQQKEKEPHLVQRRNARERRRVQLVNDGFVRLRRKIPTEPRNKKLSKVKTLRSAINYILHLQETLSEAASRQSRMEEMENVGMTVAMAHQAQPLYNEWQQQYEVPNMQCNGYNEYPVENHPGYYY